MANGRAPGHPPTRSTQKLCSPCAGNWVEVKSLSLGGGRSLPAQPRQQPQDLVRGTAADLGGGEDFALVDQV